MSHSKLTTLPISSVLAMLALLAAGAAEAEQTRELALAGPKEILEGDPESASVDTRGQISVGPELVELGRVSDRPVLSLAVGPSGTLYAGTAGGGVLRVSSGGETKVITKADDLLVSALTTVKGTLYAATNPDGRVVSVAQDGTLKTVFDPKAKYIWAMLEDGPDLLVATGEPGSVVRVTPNGPAPSPFEPGETHIRALIRHPKRGVIAGGGQKGIVYQLDGQGAFALYDSDMDEVTAFAVDKANGDLYTALVSETKPGAFDPERSIGAVAGDGAEESTTSPIKGSDVVRITESGRVDVVWSSKREGALGLAFDDKTRRLYIAAGTHAKGRGRVYALDTQDRDRLMLVARTEPPIASTIVSTPAGLVVGTAPAGRVLRVGPGLRSESTYVTSEQDLLRSSTFGRAWFDADIPSGAKLELSVRTGNTKEHDKTWSAWSSAVTSPDGGPIKVPEGRYVQLRARLTAAPGGKAPVLKSLHASVQRQNVAPNVVEVFALRRGVYMSRIPREEEREKTVTLSKSVISGLRKADEEDEHGSVRVRQGTRPGMLTISWRADDPNGDELVYDLEVRRAGDPEDAWTRIGRQIEDVFYSFDSRAYRDGRYQFRVTASDRPSNSPAHALVDKNVSEPVTIDNTAPKIRALTAASPGAGRIKVEAEAEDETSVLGTASVSVDGGPWLMLPAADGLLDAKAERLETELSAGSTAGELKPGPHAVLVRIEDDAGNSATASATVTVR